MAKIHELHDVRLMELVKKLVSEKITKEWVRDLLLQKKFPASHYGREWDLESLFEICIWDNLSQGQQEKVVEALNLIVEDDLFLKKQPQYGYWSDLLDFAIMLEQKLPGKINSKPFLIWKEQNYPNLYSGPDKVHSDFIKKLNKKIESAFSKK